MLTMQWMLLLLVADICTRSSSSSPQYFFVKRRFFPNWGIAREYLWPIDFNILKGEKGKSLKVWKIWGGLEVWEWESVYEKYERVIVLKRESVKVWKVWEWESIYKKCSSVGVIVLKCESIDKKCEVWRSVEVWKCESVKDVEVQLQNFPERMKCSFVDKYY